MNKSIPVIFGLVLAAIGLGIICNRCNNKTEVEINTLPSVDSLQERIVVKEREIDTIYIQLKNLDTNYKKVIDSVIANDPSDDVLFFIEYIGSQRNRLDSTYNIRTDKVR